MKRDNASILVVDDDAALLQSLKEILEAEGYEVTTAADGESGLRCLKAQAFDLVLSDLALPGLDGMELLKYLRRERRRAPASSSPVTAPSPTRCPPCTRGPTITLPSPWTPPNSGWWWPGPWNTAA